MLSGAPRFCFNFRRRVSFYFVICMHHRFIAFSRFFVSSYRRPKQVRILPFLSVPTAAGPKFRPSEILFTYLCPSLRRCRLVDLTGRHCVIACRSSGTTNFQMCVCSSHIFTYTVLEFSPIRFSRSVVTVCILMQSVLFCLSRSIAIHLKL